MSTRSELEGQDIGSERTAWALDVLLGIDDVPRREDKARPTSAPPRVEADAAKALGALGRSPVKAAPVQSGGRDPMPTEVVQLSRSDIETKFGVTTLSNILAADDLDHIFPMERISSTRDGAASTEIFGGKFEYDAGKMFSVSISPDAIREEPNAEGLYRLAWTLSAKTADGSPAPDYGVGERTFIVKGAFTPVELAEGDDAPEFEVENVGYRRMLSPVGGKAFNFIHTGDTPVSVMFVVHRPSEPGLVSEGSIWPWYEPLVEAVI